MVGPSINISVSYYCQNIATKTPQKVGMEVLKENKLIEEIENSKNDNLPKSEIICPTLEKVQKPIGAAFKVDAKNRLQRLIDDMVKKRGSQSVQGGLLGVLTGTCTDLFIGVSQLLQNQFSLREQTVNKISKVG